MPHHLFFCSPSLRLSEVMQASIYLSELSFFIGYPGWFGLCYPHVIVEMSNSICPTMGWKMQPSQKAIIILHLRSLPDHKGQSPYILPGNIWFCVFLQERKLPCFLYILRYGVLTSQRESKIFVLWFVLPIPLEKIENLYINCQHLCTSSYTYRLKRQRCNM